MIEGTQASDSQQVVVTCWKPPVLKTAVTSYNRVFAYDVEKTAEPAEQTIYCSVDINGVAWFDANHDGVRQPEEDVRVPGLIVELYRVDSSQPNGLLKIDQAATDGSGYFEFLGLDAGVYVVKIITESLQVSPQNVGDDNTIDSDVDPLTGESSLLSVNSETATVDVGVYRLPTALDPVEEPVIHSFTIFLPAIQQ